MKTEAPLALILAGLPTAVLLLVAGSPIPASAAIEELERHQDHIQGSGRDSVGDRQVALPDVGKPVSHNFVLVTASFTDDTLVEEAGLAALAVQKIVKTSLAHPDNRFLAAREPVNFYLDHFWVDTRISLGKSKNPEEYSYHITCSLLRLSPGETTPRRNRYVVLGQESQKAIAVAETTALPDAVNAQVAELAGQLTDLILRETNEDRKKPTS